MVNSLTSMPIPVIINTFLVPAIVAVLIIGIVLNLRYTQKNVYRRYLITMLSFWGLILSYVYIDQFITASFVCSINKEASGMRVILLGIPCFFTLASYPITVLNASILGFKYCLKMLSPMIATVALYFIGHAIIDFDPLYSFRDIDAIMNNITSAPIVMRAVLILIFLAYILTFIYNVWKAVPVYNKYVQENIADSDCNVDWVRKLLRHIGLVCILYFAMAFTNSPIVNMFYLLTVLFLFIHVVEMSIFSKTSEDIEALELRWSYKYGWRVVGEGSYYSNNILKNDFNSIMKRLNKWMTEQQPYLKVDFTINDILAQFPDLNHDDITAFFKLKDETFQLYVRSFRIAKACELIEQNHGDITLKHIFNKVGFSHYPSFSRSFVALKGVNPSEYLTACQIKYEKQQ